MDELQRSIWSRSDDIVARAILAKRGVSGGAIAGIVVGAVVGFLVLLGCLYPLVIRRVIKRRREQRLQRHNGPNGIDLEDGSTPSAPPTGASDDPQQRLSSEDSFKPPGEQSRGGLDGGSVKDFEWTPSQGQVQSHDRSADHDHDHSQPRDSSAIQIDTNVSPISCAAHHVDEVPPPASVYPNGEGEYMPNNLVNVRQGSNADYYSPTVPSSAFGMYTTEDPQAGAQSEGIKSLSRGSSLRHTLKSVFTRKSTRDQSLQSLASPTSPTFGEAATGNAPRGQEAPPTRGIINDVTSESPTELSPPESALFPSQASRSLGSPVNFQQTDPPPGAVQTPPQSPQPELKFKASPSPPTNPAPGTVNPMDIMPATTESEMWHRTEHQLYMSYNQSPPNPASSPEQYQQPAQNGQLAPLEQQYYEIPTDSPSPFALPPNVPQTEPIVQAPTPAPMELPFKEEFVDEHDVSMTDIPTHAAHLSPMPSSSHGGHSRHPSYGSDMSTPHPGPASSNPSALNTPATQLDTPSPHSDSTSPDFRHSVSPSHPASNLSPKTGTYPCDEPGCSQVFDQPHKLKHHQRYHTKDHKCTYPGCGKGFGTKTHLQRHINDRHEKKKKFHCAVPGCDYSRQGGKGFPRKDNWKRHMTKIHHLDQRTLPEPEEADEDMGGI